MDTEKSNPFDFIENINSSQPQLEQIQNQSTRLRRRRYQKWRKSIGLYNNNDDEKRAEWAERYRADHIRDPNGIWRDRRDEEARQIWPEINKTKLPRSSMKRKLDYPPDIEPTGKFVDGIGPWAITTVLFVALFLSLCYVAARDIIDYNQRDAQTSADAQTSEQPLYQRESK